MADNYLERKMEDLRSGRMTRIVSTEAAPLKMRGLFFNFPPKRVALIGDHPSYSSIVKLFLDADCKVALLDLEPAECPRHGFGDNVRHYPIRLENSKLITPELSLADNFANLLKSWRDIDILIAPGKEAEMIMNAWDAHRERFPYVLDYKSRAIILDNDPEAAFPEISIGTLMASTNLIICSNSDTQLSALIGMLVLPDNSFIDRMRFVV